MYIEKNSEVEIINTLNNHEGLSNRNFAKLQAILDKN